MSRSAAHMARRWRIAARSRSKIVRACFSASVARAWRRVMLARAQCAAPSGLRRRGAAAIMSTATGFSAAIRSMSRITSVARL